MALCSTWAHRFTIAPLIHARECGPVATHQGASNHGFTLSLSLSVCIFPIKSLFWPDLLIFERTRTPMQTRDT
uniref:Putative secreted protein n=1 Tax=Anopheles darlingi TaxID=43151 RepID=A0A2M4D0Z5_ANODA